MGVIELTSGYSNDITPSDPPSFLYHYTTVDSLALILSRKTIRFTCLNRLDDPLEEMAYGPKNPPRCKFVSCWTDLQIESIPMWREYASEQAGVRIALPPNPFELFHDEDDLLNTRMLNAAFKGCSDLDCGNETDDRLRVQVADALKSNVWSYDFLPSRRILYKVDYTDDISRVIPATSEKAVGEFNNLVRTDELGRVKHSCWDYQQEWRYLITVYPGNPILLSRHECDSSKSLIDFLLDKNDDDCRLPEYFDLHLSDEAMSAMAITLSPNITPGNREIVRLLVKEYCPSAQICNSVIKLR